MPVSIQKRDSDTVSPFARQRRVIHVDGRTLTGVVCPTCPPWQTTVIFPESSLDAHLSRHGAPRQAGEPVARYRRGRPPGSVNRNGQMSSTGVIHKRGIKITR